MQLLFSIEAFKSALPDTGRLLGMDYGTKTIGLGLCDALRMLASPLETIEQTKFSKDIERIKVLVAEHQISGIVIGYPVNMDGSEGPRCQATRQFARNLLQHFSLPVLLWDERMSSVAVNRTMLEADLSRKRRSELVDKLAASYILQGVLDGMPRR